MGTHNPRSIAKLPEASLAGLEQELADGRRAMAEVRRARAALDASFRFREVCRHASDEETLTQAACHILVETRGFRMSWVGLAEDGSERRVRVAARAGFGLDYLNTITVRWDDSAEGRGPTGTAIRHGWPVICQRLRDDPGFAPWRDAAIARGYAAAAALPLVVEGRTIGALTAYSPDEDAFDPVTVSWLAGHADDLANAIGALRSRRSTQAAHARLSADNDALRRRLQDQLETRDRLRSLEAEVNALLAEAGRPARYPSVASAAAGSPEPAPDADDDARPV
jgi:GAF domain-containing protein